MAYNPILHMLGYRAPVQEGQSLFDQAMRRKQMDIAQQQARDQHSAAQQQQTYLSQAHPLMLAQQGLANRGAQLGMPGREVEANQATIKGNYLEQMFPGVTRSFDQSGNPIPQAAQEPAGNRFQGMSLSELRQLKMQAGPVGEYLGQFIDPIIKSKSDAEELGPALNEIAAVAKMPGGTREEARAKSAALVSLKAKYPYLTNDNRFEKAIDDALPKNPDPVYNPMQMDMAGFQREKFENEKSQKLLDRVARYTKESEKERESATQLDSVHKTLESLGVKGGIYGNPNAIDIPGFGVGEKAFRAYAQSDKAVELRGQVAALMNAYRNGLFGASLTEGEQRAFEEFSGTGIVANQAALFTGLKAINKALSQKLRPESDDMLPLLDKQGILYHKNLPKEEAKAPKVGPYSDAEKEARYQAWKKANGK